MNIGLLHSTPSQPANSITVGVAVLSKNLDTVEKAGESLIKMMEQSVTPHLGQNIDVKG